MSRGMTITFVGANPDNRELDRALTAIDAAVRLARIREDGFALKVETESIWVRASLTYQANESCIHLNWSGGTADDVAVWCLAAAFGAIRDARIVDSYSGRLSGKSAAEKRVQKYLRAYRSEIARLGRGLDDRSLAQLLAPILAARPDLQLVGRRLIITPVRHLVRGVAFDRIRNPREVRLHRFVIPLYQGPTIGYSFHASPHDGRLN